MGLTQTEKRRLARAIQVAIPNLVAKRSLLLATPRGRFLRGFCIDNSCLWVFVQPLFLPQTGIVFTFGKMLGGGSGGWAWHAKDVDTIGVVARQEGEPFFRSVWSPETFLRWNQVEMDDYNHREAFAYALVAAGQFEKGARALRTFVRMIDDDDAREWPSPGKRDALQLAELAETDPPGAEKLLAKWEAGTIAALRVEDVL